MNCSSAGVTCPSLSRSRRPNAVRRSETTYLSISYLMLSGIIRPVMYLHYSQRLVLSSKENVEEGGHAMDISELTVHFYGS